MNSKLISNAINHILNNGEASRKEITESLLNYIEDFIPYRLDGNSIERQTHAYVCKLKRSINQ